MKTYDGNLLHHFAGRAKPEVSAIAHVCNCQGVMASGVALAIKKAYPAAYTAYKNESLKYKSGLPLGSMSGAAIREDKVVYNLHAQMYYGNVAGRRYLDYEALCVSLEKVREDMIGRGLRTLGVPHKMGSDRAGGDWNVVSAMLSSVFDFYDIAVSVIKLP